MEFSPIAPVERRAITFPAGTPAPPARSRVKRALGAVGTFGLAYLLMAEQALGLLPFLLVLSWLWVKGSVECAQARGAALDW